MTIRSPLLAYLTITLGAGCQASAQGGALPDDAALESARASALCRGAKLPAGHPFAPGGEVVPASALVGEGRGSSSDDIATTRATGVRFDVPAPLDESEVSFERWVRCYHRHPASAGPDDPLAVPGTEVEVWARRGRLVVDITSADDAVVRELERRALAFR